MRVIDFYIRIFLCYFVECPFPEIKGKGKYICLSAEGKFLPLVPLFAIFKRETDAPLNAFSRINGFLDRNLIGCPFLQYSSCPCIQPFRIFPDDNKIYILRVFCFSGDNRRPGYNVTGRKLIYWSSSNLSLRRIPFSRIPGLYVRVANRSEIDRIIFP